MHSPNTTPAPGQLHATLPGPNGTHACLTLYNACPHNSRSTIRSVQCKIPQLHHNPLPLPSAPPPRIVEYNDDRGRNIVETTCATLLTLPETSRTRVIEYVQDEGSQLPGTIHSTSPTPETAMSTSLARQILVKTSPIIPAAPPLRPIAKRTPSLPTVYLLSFSTDRTPTARAFAALLNNNLPPDVPLRYTIDARSFLVPQTRICEDYSGVAGIVQNEVLRDSQARQEIDYTVDELTWFVRQGGQGTGVAVCCTAGTHRSVAIAELVALGIRREVRRLGSKHGVKVVVRHVHRVRGSKDPY